MKRTNTILICAIALGLAVSAVCTGKTITVNAAGGADFTSIQTAIADSGTVDYDQIEVAPGTYYEAINFIGKAIRLYSSGGPDVTIIDGTGNYHVVQCTSGEDPNTILDGFTITGGYAQSPQGGGMYNDYSDPTVNNCIFTGNTGYYGGGGMYNLVSNPIVSNCTFSGNTAIDDDGGGIYNYFSSPLITHCTFLQNSASRGGGIFNNYFSTPLITHCIFRQNSAYYGGGINNFNSSSPFITNCIFTGNSAGTFGGGIFNYSNSSPAVTNSTFLENAALNGGGMYNYDYCNLTVANCILWDNSPDQFYNNNSNPAVNYSNIQGGYTGTGNIDADPLFADAPGGNLRLSPGSPCIDAGDNSAVPEGITADLNGWSRFINDLCTPDTGIGTAPIVDMGAYEFLPADRNGSGFVNLPDYQVLAADWLQTGPGLSGDLNCDGMVDLTDLAEQAAYWLEGT